MSANLIHNTKYRSKYVFNRNCSKATKNINKHILQNRSRQLSTHILHRTTYTHHNATSFSKIILHDFPFLAYEHSEGKRTAIQPTPIAQ